MGLWEPRMGEGLFECQQYSFLGRQEDYVLRYFTRYDLYFCSTVITCSLFFWLRHTVEELLSNPVIIRYLRRIINSTLYDKDFWPFIPVVFVESRGTLFQQVPFRKGFSGNSVSGTNTQTLISFLLLCFKSFMGVEDLCSPWSIYDLVPEPLILHYTRKLQWSPFSTVLHHFYVSDP